MLFIVIILSTTSVVHGLPPPPLQAIRFEDFVDNNNNNQIDNATTFRYRYLNRLGKCLPSKPNGQSIRIAATENVWEQALTVACITLAKLTKYMPDDVFKTTSETKGVGIFTRAETLAVYSENANLVDRKECYRTCSGPCNDTCTYDGRKFSEVAGVTNSISLSNMESILCLPHDIYEGSENILTHEFSHLVHQSLAKAWKDKITAAYETAKFQNIWSMTSYAMVNEFEYFAIATETFFYDIIRTDTIATGGMNLCDTITVCRDEDESRRFLRRRDPTLFECLSYVFTDNRPRLLSGLKPCMG